MLVECTNSKVVLEAIKSIFLRPPEDETDESSPARHKTPGSRHGQSKHDAPWSELIVAVVEGMTLYPDSHFLVTPSMSGPSTSS